jgi:uncharacterized damage-inducible protein DinB
VNPIDYIRRCILRDLGTFEVELAAYPDDASVWTMHPQIPNVAGTLTLHAAGNLRHFIGATLGATGYVRDREAEFSTRNLPRRELLVLLHAARDEVDATLRTLSPARLEEHYPLEIGGTTLSTGQMLVHLATHLSYHLGQADIHRRVVTFNPKGVGAVGVKELLEGDG